MDPNSYIFEATVWLWQGDAPASWHFVTIPEEISDDIKDSHFGPRRGFGSIKVNATIGSTKWNTSIFPDSKTGCYLLPLKKKVREAEEIEFDSEVRVQLSIETMTASL